MTGLKIWRSGEKAEKAGNTCMCLFLKVRWSECTPLESFHSLLSELGFSLSHPEFQHLLCVLKTYINSYCDCYFSTVSLSLGVLNE